MKRVYSVIVACVELGRRAANIPLTPWYALSREYAVASGGIFDKQLYTAVIQQARILDPDALCPATVSQATWYAQKIDIVPDCPMIQYYGCLREGYFVWPFSNREGAFRLHGLCDQRMFALTLLLHKERDAYARHISHYPTIFSPAYIAHPPAG